MAKSGQVIKLDALRSKVDIPIDGIDDPLLREINIGLMSIAEAGEFLRTSRSSANELVRQGKLRFTVVLGCRKVLKIDVLRLAAEGVTGGWDRAEPQA